MAQKKTPPPPTIKIRPTPVFQKVKVQPFTEEHQEITRQRNEIVMRARLKDTNLSAATISFFFKVYEGFSKKPILTGMELQLLSGLGYNSCNIHSSALCLAGFLKKVNHSRFELGPKLSDIKEVKL